MFSMTEDKEKEEIMVKAPAKPVVSPQRKAEKAIAKSLEEERFEVLQISSRIGAYFGTAAIFVGVLLLCLLAYVSITSQVGLISLSPESTSFSLVLWVFTGLVNIITGFLLMGSD
jgi:hypothetical protein